MEAASKSPGDIAKRILEQFEEEKPAHIDAELAISMVAGSLARTGSPGALKRMLENIQKFHDLLGPHRV